MQCVMQASGLEIRSWQTSGVVGFYEVVFLLSVCTGLVSYNCSRLFLEDVSYRCRLSPSSSLFISLPLPLLPSPSLSSSSSSPRSVPSSCCRFRQEIFLSDYITFVLILVVRVSSDYLPALTNKTPSNSQKRSLDSKIELGGKGTHHEPLKRQKSITAH